MNNISINYRRDSVIESPQFKGAINFKSENFQ